LFIFDMNITWSTGDLGKIKIYIYTK